MQIDRIALNQGIIDAHYDNQIPDWLYTGLLSITRHLSTSGKYGRDELNYADFLKALSDFGGSSLYLINLWKYLGKSISEGISAAN